MSWSNSQVVTLVTLLAIRIVFHKDDEVILAFLLYRKCNCWLIFLFLDRILHSLESAWRKDSKVWSQQRIGWDCSKCHRKCLLYLVGIVWFLRGSVLWLLWGRGCWFMFYHSRGCWFLVHHCRGHHLCLLVPRYCWFLLHWHWHSLCLSHSFYNKCFLSL